MSIYHLPSCELNTSAPLSMRFLDRGCSTFHDACEWLQRLPYGHPSVSGNTVVLFEEGRGTCLEKHGLAVRLAEELELPVFRYEGFYRMDEKIVPDSAPVLNARGWDYLPRMHCFLESDGVRADLTEGNCHGKTWFPRTYEIIVQVPAEQSRTEYRALYCWGLDYYRRLDSFWCSVDNATLLSALDDFFTHTPACGI